ncbi:MAG: 2-oxoglutarate dehydrogenase E1 component [Bacteroidales bacterium]
MDRYSFLSNADPEVFEELYNKYKEDPTSVEKDWQMFFNGFEFATGNNDLVSSDSLDHVKEFKVINLIEDYRERGHLFTKTNPVRKRRDHRPALDLENYGLSENDLDTVFHAGSQIGLGSAKLRDIIEALRITYCQSIGVEYKYIRNTTIVHWLEDRMERLRNTPHYHTLDDKKWILKKLTRAVLFEKFIHKRFPGQKRFSLEGAEALIPALEAIMEKGAELGNDEFVIGMPHRGRLNVLANILRKPYMELFSEFQSKGYKDQDLLGDVKYHLGYTNARYATNGKKIRLTLSPNPSHLEAVAPVVEGIARAKIDTLYNGDYKKVTPIIIHGDASMAGQGVVYEIAQMSELKGYKTGGTVHLAINNQIGFTTDYLDGRSSTYCTDVAKVTQSPIFHVNGDDPESLVYTIQFAMEFREVFNKDVYIDLLCYRKYGHNEGDEPRFTQPILYKEIEKHPNPMEIFRDKMIAEGFVKADDAAAFEKHTNSRYEESLNLALQKETNNISFFLKDIWKDIRKAKNSDFSESPDTSISMDTLKFLSKAISVLPKDKKFFRKTVRLQKQRGEMLEKTGKLDWAMAELSAYGSLLLEGYPVRISGQDSQRGTFSHRHAVLRVEDSEEQYIPLANLDKMQARFEIYNSPLSEYGVLGYEYGYSLTSPYSLTIWEAQFGDFSNGAQVIMDQFLSSAEDKWNVMNDLVLFLPHGYEGQGPEHSSARVERYLALCAENNMQIVNASTPANFFHVLRRQLKREFRKPLVIFTPKSLLRHPQCVSSAEDFIYGGFKEVIDDEFVDVNKVDKVIVCTGKVYYDLIARRKELKNESVALIRLEQLYPLPKRQLMKLYEKYAKAKKWIWLQEEPYNMGSWNFIHAHFPQIPFKCIARPASGSPATGSLAFHKIRQNKILSKAFEQCNCHRLGEECKMICIGNSWQDFIEKNEKTDNKDIKSEGKVHSSKN